MRSDPLASAPGSKIHILVAPILPFCFSFLSDSAASSAQPIPIAAFS